MSILDYMKNVPSMTVEEAREFIEEKEHTEFNLVDVRELYEYERVHIPGSVLVPLGELADRVEEFDRDKPSIVYCAAGGRSRAGTSIMLNAGFKEVYNMKGGMNAWEGYVAQGPPEYGMAYFTEAAGTADFIALAWALEEGTRRFYEAMAGMAKNAGSRDLYGMLQDIEEKHKEMVRGLYSSHAGEGSDPDQVSRRLKEDGELVVEGGLKLNELISFLEGKKDIDVLEYSLALEAQLYDLYLRLKLETENPRTLEVIDTLAGEEKKHIDMLMELHEELSG